jgi:Kef-type K+ transport system membrane component KefB
MSGGTVFAVAIVLAAAHFGGLLARRVGQPAVIGQLAVGVLLGPTVLGATSARLFTHDTTSAVKTLGTIGLVAFAFVLGARLERAHLPAGRRFVLVAATVFAVPFAAGAGVGLALYADHRYVDGTTVDRLPFVLFVAAAISITAFPVLARIVDDHGLRGTRVGDLAVSCAAVNDLLSWLALAVALLANRGLAGSLGLVKLLAGGVGLIIALTLVAYLGDRLRPGASAWATLAVAAGLTGAAIVTSRMGLHYVFGGFAAGVVAARPSLARASEVTVRACTSVAAVLLPLYLVLPGATIDFRTLDLHNGGELLLVIGAAAAAKVGAGVLSGRAAGLTRHEAATLGLLLDTRRLVELVALAVGRAAGILDTNFFAVLVIMAVVTTVATSPGLRLLERRRERRRPAIPLPP